MDDDFVPQDYRLQYRKSTASHFEDVYVGSETEFIVLHIDPNVDYQFRVCARGDGRQEWSPWSVPQIGRTTLVPHGTVSLLFVFILILSSAQCSWRSIAEWSCFLCSGGVSLPMIQAWCMMSYLFFCTRSYSLLNLDFSLVAREAVSCSSRQLSAQPWKPSETVLAGHKLRFFSPCFSTLPKNFLMTCSHMTSYLVLREKTSISSSLSNL